MTLRELREHLEQHPNIPEDSEIGVSLPGKRLVDCVERPGPLAGLPHLELIFAEDPEPPEEDRA